MFNTHPPRRVTRTEKNSQHEGGANRSSILTKAQIMLMSLAILGGTWALTTAMIEDSNSAERASNPGNIAALPPPQIQVGNDSKCNACVKLWFRQEGNCSSQAGSLTSVNCNPGTNGSSVMVNYPAGYNLLVKGEVFAGGQCTGTIVATWTCPSNSANTWNCSPTTYGLWGDASTGLRIMHF